MNRNLEIFVKIVIPALGDTIYMVFFATLISIIFGFFIAVILYLTGKDGLKPNYAIYKISDTIVNIIRSLPFIILVVSIIPLTRSIAGTSIGRQAALVPLIISSAPFLSRLFEGSFNEVDAGLIEAGKSFGASDMQIILRIVVPEAIPSIINNITFAIIAIISSTAMAGAVGAGGLGAVAISYGYQNFNDLVMYGTVIILVVLVQIIQRIGSKVSHKAV